MTPIVVAYGGGVNSTAMLVEFHRRGIKPDLIIFADTGGERPETYEGIRLVSEWCVAHGMPGVVTVKSNGKTLERDSNDRNALPSIAYGFKTCSQRWKMQPQLSYIRREIGKVRHTKAIGFDAGESRRAKVSPDELCVNWYPLIEWDIYREDCVEICKSEGLPTAKSSCFFCPSMKKHEILELKKLHPELMARALAMEANAHLTSIKGLGRNFAWRDLVAADDAQMKMFCDAGSPDVPCGCYDG